ncbi:MAG: Mpo1-like protein [Bacteroidia bacterium]
MANKFKSFKEFYPFYLQQHSEVVCRTLHFVGTFMGLIFLITVLATFDNKWWAFASPLFGYGMGFIGHFFFEHNKPATFRNPLYSFAGDILMFIELLTGKIKFKS